jgi:hypothetical protein
MYIVLNSHIKYIFCQHDSRTLNPNEKEFRMSQVWEGGFGFPDEKPTFHMGFQKKLAAAAGTAAADQAVLPTPRKRHGGIPLPISDQLRRTDEDTDVVFRSNKRPALLRRDIVNDCVLGARMVEAKGAGSEEKCF